MIVDWIDDCRLAIGLTIGGLSIGFVNASMRQCVNASMRQCVNASIVTRQSSIRQSSIVNRQSVNQQSKIANPSIRN
jgi:hypothetical protein